MTIELSRMTKSELYTRWQDTLDVAAASGVSLTDDEKKLCFEIDRELKWRAEHPIRIPGSGNQHSDRPSSTFAYFDHKTTRWTTAVAHGESVCDATGDNATVGVPSLGACIRGMALGNWRGMTGEQALVRENSDNQGGFLVPTRLSQDIIDRARAKMVMSAAGMRTIPFGDGGTLELGRVETDATAVWRNEGQTIVASGPTFSKLVMTPHCLAVLCPVSIEWLEDVSNGEQLLEQVITNAMAVELDRAVLRGGGAAEPTGVLNTTDVHTTAVGGPWNYDTLVNAMEDVWSDNGPSQPTAIILSPAAESFRRRIKDGEGRYAVADGLPTVNVPFLMTSACPDDEIYVGDFSRVLLAVKTQFKIEILPAGTGADSSGGTYNATTQMYKWVRVYGRFDTHIEQPKHLAVLTGCTNT